MILKSKRGLILILSSPSGAGKTTLAKKIELSDRNFKISVSYTTRTPRTNEVDGVDYNFVTIKKFQELASQDKFLEQAKVFGNYYATLKGPIEDNLAKGIDYLFDIDWQGTEQVKKIMPSDIVSVFILPPSIDDLNILSELTKNIFNTKRKMVSKALKKILNEKELQIIDFNNIKNLRAENLDFNFYYKLVDLIKSRS